MKNPNIKGCDRNCWTIFHHTCGLHSTDCALTLAVGQQVDQLDKAQLERAQRIIENRALWYA